MIHRLSPSKIGMIVDRGNDFPIHVQQELDLYGEKMWLFRDHPERETTRAVNIYHGDCRGFEYLTPRLRVSPNDLKSTALHSPAYLHFICSPQRASEALKEVDTVSSWSPFIICEPLPDRCVPEELPSLKHVVERIDVLSPNAEEALSILSMPQPPQRKTIERAAHIFLELGAKAVIIRSGAMGAYVAPRQGEPGRWVNAYFSIQDTHCVKDVTGAGNAFLGGLAAGLCLCDRNLLEASLYATVSASYAIEQYGLPRLSSQILPDGSAVELWNGDEPPSRLQSFKERASRTL